MTEKTECPLLKIALAEPIFTIDRITQEGREDLFLLTERQRARVRLHVSNLNSAAAAVAAQDEKRKNPETEPLLRELEAQILAAETELASDDLARSLFADHLITAEFEFGGEEGYINAIIHKEGNEYRIKREWSGKEGSNYLDLVSFDTDERVQIEKMAAYEALSPKPVRGWEGEPSPMLYRLLSEECHRRLYPWRYYTEDLSLRFQEAEQAKQQGAAPTPARKPSRKKKEAVA